MNHLLKFFFAIFVVSTCTSTGFCVEKKDYEEFVKKTDKTIKEYATEKYYDELKFTNKETGEQKSFKDFTPMQKFIFFVMRGTALDHELEEVYNKWKENLKSAEEKPGDDKEASKADLEKYMSNLMESRKKNAVKIEGLVSELFKKWPDEFTKEEKETFLKSLKEYHDKNNLIKREK